MPHYVSKVQKDKDGNPIMDKQGFPITKSYLADAEGNILCETAFEDDGDLVRLRVEVEGHKELLRHGMKLYKIDAEGVRKLEDKVAENNEGSIAIAEKEFAEENKEKAAIEKEFKERQKQKVKTKP